MSAPNPAPRPTKRATLADYVIRYDLAATIEEARSDYSQSAAGGPRLLAQSDITARFRKIAPSIRRSHE
jgi:hypothetical protein